MGSSTYRGDSISDWSISDHWSVKRIIVCTNNDLIGGAEMALISCDECGKQISDKAKACPNCGYPIDINTSASHEINFAGNEYKPIDDYNFSELNKMYGQYGRSRLFNIAVKHHWDIEGGELEAAFIYKYIIEKYPHNVEASESRELLKKLANDNPSLFMARPRYGTAVPLLSSDHSISSATKQEIFDNKNNITAESELPRVDVLNSRNNNNRIHEIPTHGGLVALASILGFGILGGLCLGSYARTKRLIQEGDFDGALKASNTTYVNSIIVIVGISVIIIGFIVFISAQS